MDPIAGMSTSLVKSCGKFGHGVHICRKRTDTSGHGEQSGSGSAPNKTSSD